MDDVGRPLLKWPGGKRWLARDIITLFPQPLHGYHEAFFGGGAVFFRLYAMQMLPRRVVISDINEELMTCYRAVRDDPDRVIQLLRWHERMYSREHFYEVRAWDRQPNFASLPAADRAARMIFLNRTCYNGLYRTDKHGRFNAPFGRYKRVTICEPDHIRAVSRALAHADIRICDFADALNAMQPGDVAYLDPPYDSLDGKGFTTYVGRPFRDSDQRRLAAAVRTVLDRNVCVVLSNADTPLIRHLYREYDHLIVAGRRSINCKGDRRAAVREMLVVAQATTRRVRACASNAA